MNGTASPAEVFHRNLVDAVSNVEGIMASPNAFQEPIMLTAIV